ncbi:MAG: trypsin-like peptidase domain-containing protein [Planctomycetes bacterium]|nr:trypsin-like peptidase domain-containing protein [Planctomycetota bacterium]
MRRIVAAIIAISILLLGRYATGPAYCRAEEGRSGHTICRCEDEPSEHLQPVGVEDRDRMRRLIREGAELIDKDRVVDMAVLVEQLKRTRCQLELPPAEPIAEGPVEVYAKAKASVVVVAGLYKCEKCTGWHATTATGFVIASSGAVVTNYHVINNPDKKAMVVMTSNWQVAPVAEVLAASRADDLAIVRIDAKDLTPLPVADASSPAPIGSPVNVISHPAGRFYFYTTGIVSRYMKVRSAMRQADTMLITADFARGSSGAPVLDNGGRVAAIVASTNSIYYTETEDQQKNLQMVFKVAIPSKSLRKLVESEE